VIALASIKARLIVLTAIFKTGRIAIEASSAAGLVASKGWCGERYETCHDRARPGFRFHVLCRLEFLPTVI
jgi:hypothetical protein